MQIENKEELQAKYDELLNDYNVKYGKKSVVEQGEILLELRDIYEKLHPEVKERRLKYGNRNKQNNNR